MFAALFFLAAAATDPLSAADARVAEVAYRLQTANTALCARRAPVAGLSLQMVDQYAPADRAGTGLGDRPTLSAVVAGSAAARAGLKVGDAIAAIGGTATPTATKRTTFDSVARAEAMLAAALAKGPAALTLGDGRQVTLTAAPACASDVQLLPQKGLNAAADGQVVQLGGKLYDFAESEDDLAAIIGHELAHNFLGHRARMDAEDVSTGLFAGLGKNGAKLRDIEFQADRLSVWLIARAGYRVEAIAPFWTRLGRRAGVLISSGTHPGFKERVRRIEAAAAQVVAQRASGAPLLPPSQDGNSR